MKRFFDVIKIFFLSVSNFWRSPQIISNKIAILLWGGLGDAVMSLELVRACLKSSIERNEKLYIIGKPTTIELFQYEFGNINIEYLKLEPSAILKDFQYFANKQKEIRKVLFRELFVPISCPTADVLALNVIAEHKIIADEGVHHIDTRIFGHLHKIIYDVHVNNEGQNDSFMHRLYCLTNYITPQAKETIPNITKRYMPASVRFKYIVVSPGASTFANVWDTNKYVEICKYILTNHFYIYLLGSSADGRYIDEIYNNIEEQYKKQVCIKIEMEIREMLQLIGGAFMLIGNDSGSVHMAAAMGIKSICILGGRDNRKILPYQINNNIYNKEPICISAPKMKCYGCHTIFHRQGRGNRECKKRLKQGENSLCIHSISSEMVLAVIRSEINNDN